MLLNKESKSNQTKPKKQKKQKQKKNTISLFFPVKNRSIYFLGIHCLPTQYVQLK